MSKWQWSVVIALCKVVLKLSEEVEIAELIDEETLNTLREAIIRSNA